MKKMKALLGLTIGLVIGFVIGSVVSNDLEVDAVESAQKEIKYVETKAEDKQEDMTTNEVIAFESEEEGALDKVEPFKQYEMMKEMMEVNKTELANATIETTAINNTENEQNEHGETEEMEFLEENDELYSVRTEGDLIGTILAFEIYEEVGATDILVEFENGEEFYFTDWYSPKLVVGEKRLIHFISFDYGDEGTETYYYILDNRDAKEKKYETVETVYSSGVIQSIQAIQGSDLNEKEFILALADGTKALANFFAPEDEFEQLGLIEGASVNVIIYKSFNVAGELAKKEVYFNLYEEDTTDTSNTKNTTTTGEATTDTTDTTTGEAMTDTVNTTDEAMTDTVNTTDEAMTDTVNITDEAMTDTVNTTTIEATVDTSNITDITTTGEINQSVVTNT